MSPTRVLRRTLEEALETNVASTLLFEALGAAGSNVPQTRQEILDVVRGPLRELLARRLDADETSSLIDRIEAKLAPARDDDLSTVEVPLDELVESTRREDETAVFATADRSVPVVVIAAGPGLARKLGLALGSNRVSASTASSAPALLERLEPDAPPIVLLDATDVPAIEVRAICDAVRGVPPTTTCVLYGAELPFGRTFLAAVGGAEREWISLELREGVAPLLDLIRSRRSGRR